MIKFASIGGVPVHYDRDDRRQYGTKGRLVRSGGPVTPEFFAALNAWMATLGELCPWGRPSILVTGGIRGAGTDPANRHTQGRAIDIDALWWGDRALVTRDGQPVAHYLAVEATLRLHFGTVLDRWYNAAHVDHWHVDDGHAPGWHPSRSLTVFLQAALNELWGRGLKVDGKFGPRTEAAALDVLQDGRTLAASWDDVLRAVARRGFAV